MWEEKKMEKKLFPLFVIKLMMFLTIACPLESSA
jgi:hypothetical protein